MILLEYIFRLREVQVYSHQPGEFGLLDHYGEELLRMRYNKSPPIINNVFEP